MTNIKQCCLILIKYSLFFTQTLLSNLLLIIHVAVPMMSDISNPYIFVKQQLFSFQNSEENFHEKLSQINQTRNKISNQIVNLTKDYERKIKQLQNKLDEAVTQNEVLAKENKLQKRDLEAMENRLVEKEKLISMLILQQGDREKEGLSRRNRWELEKDEREKTKQREKQKVLAKGLKMNYQYALSSTLTHQENDHQPSHKQNYQSQRETQKNNENQFPEKLWKMSDEMENCKKNQNPTKTSNKSVQGIEKVTVEENLFKQVKQSSEVSKNGLPLKPKIIQHSKNFVNDTAQKTQTQQLEIEQINFEFETGENLEIIENQQQNTEQSASKEIEKFKIKSESGSEKNESLAKESVRVTQKNKAKKNTSKTFTQQQRYLQDEGKQKGEETGTKLSSMEQKEPIYHEHIKQQQKQQIFIGVPTVLRPRKFAEMNKAKSKKILKHQPMYFQPIQNQNKLPIQGNSNNEKNQQNTESQSTHQNPNLFISNALTEDLHQNFTSVGNQMVEAQQSSIDYTDNHSVASTEFLHMLDSQCIPQDTALPTASETKKMPKKKHNKREIKNIDPNSFV